MAQMTFLFVFRIWVDAALKVGSHLRTNAFLGFIKSVRI